MSDDELDKDWVPNGRPQSTLARSFSAALNDLFMIDSSVDTLAVSVDKKKQAVSSQSQELEALEARLRHTEELLKEKAASSKSPLQNGSGRSSPRRRTPLPTSFGIPLNKGDEKDTVSPNSPLARFASSGPLSSDCDAPRPLPKSDARSDTLPSPMKTHQDGGDFVMVDRTEDSEKIDREKNGNELPQPRSRLLPPLSKH
ncbi:MAG: hypothetical protein M1840_002972 [Geoglossum simile]|nr:MAG: hypothetical protein M1840_002972 [Geoglossum simile]